MSQDNPKTVVRFDHNYKNRSPMHEISEDIANELQSLKKAYRRLKDKFADNTGLNLELLQEDLEDVRVSTRVADRFKNLQDAVHRTEIARETIDALKVINYQNTIIAEMLPWDETILSRTSAAMDQLFDFK